MTLAQQHPHGRFPSWTAVGLLAARQPTRRQARALDRVAEAMRQGRTMPDAWACQRRAFPKRDRIFLDRAAERERLPVVLEVAGRFDVLRRRYYRQVRELIGLPAAIWGTVCAVALILLTVPLKEFAHLYADYYGGLPDNTMLLMTAREHLATVVVAMTIPLLAAWGFWLLLRDPWSSIVDYVLLRMPLIGTIVKTGRSIAFSRALSLGVAAGLTESEAAEMACEAIGFRRDPLPTAAAAAAPSAGGDSAVQPWGIVTGTTRDGSALCTSLIKQMVAHQDRNESELGFLGPAAMVLLMAVASFFAVIGIMSLFAPLFHGTEHLT